MTYFDSSYYAIREASEKLNAKLRSEDLECGWKNAEEYETIRKMFSDDVLEHMDEMINDRALRLTSRLLTDFFMELGFDEGIARAKASDMISITRRNCC